MTLRAGPISSVTWGGHDLTGMFTDVTLLPQRDPGPPFRSHHRGSMSIDIPVSPALRRWFETMRWARCPLPERPTRVERRAERRRLARMLREQRRGQR